MLKFEGIHYNNQKWQLVANDGKVLFEGDYISCRKMDLCQYFEHKKLKGYADFFNSSSSFCCGVI